MPSFDLLDPLGDYLYEIDAAVCSLSSQDLNRLATQCGDVTTTNCAWVTHRIAPLVLHLVDSELYRRSCKAPFDDSHKQPQQS